ncbi:MAG: response regulator [Candidatus Nanogingivalis sp.]
MKRILIVEDNRILAENFARILRSDFEISHADSAGSAISQIDNSFPDVILLDILLSGHSAFALLNELQSYVDTAKIPVVICSDLTENLDENSLKKYQVKSILDKSKISPKELREICRKVVNESN